MIWLRILLSRFTALFRKKGLEQRLEEELKSHLEMLAEENLKKGMTAEEAHYAALRSFGGVEQTKESYREQRGLPLIESLAQDLRYAFRMLAKNPGFTAVAVITLGLGIGASTALFSVVNSVLIRPLPYKDPNRLVMLFEKDKTFHVDVLQPYRNGLISTSVPGLLDWRARTDVFDEVGAYFWFPSQFVFTSAREPAEVFGGRVTANLFTLLGVAPMLGRSFLPGEDRPGENDKVLLGYGFWKQRFNSDPGIVGKSTALSGRACTVVGVMPPGFEFPRGEQLWVPYALEIDPKKQSRGSKNLEVIARLKAGVSLERAETVLQTLAAVNELRFPRAQKNITAAVVRHRFRRPDRLLQPGQHAAGARSASHAGNGNARRVRRRAVPAATPGDCGNPSAGRSGRRRRAVDRDLGGPGARCARFNHGPPTPGRAPRLAGATVCARLLARRRGRFRTGPRAAGFQN
jgi:putative ABC transport system permease protein